MCNTLPLNERVIIIAIIGLCISFLGIIGGVKELVIRRENTIVDEHNDIYKAYANINATQGDPLQKFAAYVPRIARRATFGYQIAFQAFAFISYLLLLTGAKIGNKYLLLPFLFLNTMYMISATMIIIFVSFKLIYPFPVFFLPLLLLVLILRLLFWMQTTVNQLCKQLSLEVAEPNQALSPTTQVVITTDAEMNTAVNVPVTQSVQPSFQPQYAPKYVAYPPDEEQPPSYYEAVRPRAVEAVRLAP